MVLGPSSAVRQRRHYRASRHLPSSVKSRSFHVPATGGSYIAVAAGAKRLVEDPDVGLRRRCREVLGHWRIPLKKWAGRAHLAVWIGDELEAFAPSCRFERGIGISFASLRRFSGGCGCEAEPAARAVRALRSRRRSASGCVEVGEQISAFFRSRREGHVVIGSGDSRHVASPLVDRPQFAGRRVRRARLEFTGVAVQLAGAVAHQPVLIDEGWRHPDRLLPLPQFLPSRTGIESRRWSR